jgi:hypothetical protein
MVTKSNGLVAKLDLLMLRMGHPGEVFADLDNRLKIILDALRKPDQENQITEVRNGQQYKLSPQENESPF